MNSVTVALCLVVLVFVQIAVSKHATCHRYIVHAYDESVESWESARAACQKNDSDLVKIESAEEDAYLASFLRGMQVAERQDGWWIGGIYKKGEWEWMDGTDMVYTNFHFDAYGFDADRNYAAIFIKNGYTWGFLSPMSFNNMGYVCESNFCEY